MAAIGILGGMGPQASAHLQTLLVRDTPRHTLVTSDSDFPGIVLLSVPVPNFVENKQNMHAAKQILLQKTKLLEQAGCTVNGIACNTAHILLPELQAVTNVPFLSMPQLVSAKIAEAGFERVGLLATPTTLGSTLYDDALGNVCELIRPDQLTATRVETLIFRQLRGSATESDRIQLHQLVDRFRSSQQLDAVILGCTELPLLFGETLFGETADPSVIDTLQVLSDGLLTDYFTSHKSQAVEAVL